MASSALPYRIHRHDATCRYYAEPLGDGIQLNMVQIPAGSFTMGSPADELERFDDEGPQHPVQLQSFFMGMYPITQAQWRAVVSYPPMNSEEPLKTNPSNFKGDDRPVEQVNWHEATEFCARLSAATQRDYRLPTEAEWEYACRAGTTTPFAFGDTLTTDLANYDGSHIYDRGIEGEDRGKTTPAGQFPANAFGLYDMHGNVWEWCADHWHSSYGDKPDDIKAQGNIPWLKNNQDSPRFVLRGGSWFYNPGACRSAYRFSSNPDARISSLGFRVVCSAARTLS